jgi:hypothetical protein
MEDADEKALYGSWSRDNPHRPGMFRWWRRLMRDIDFALSWGAVRQEWKALKVLGPARFIYSTFFYRMHMRWLHKRNRHAMRRVGPMPDGVSFDRCDWCGHTVSDRS